MLPFPLKKRLARIIEMLNSILFPKRCAGCRRNGSYLCPSCAINLAVQPRYNDKAVLHTADYAEPAVRRLIWLLKYRGIREIAGIFAGWLHEAILEELEDFILYRETAGRIILIPIPLSRKRRGKRGFNQSEEIARRLADIDPRAYRLGSEILIKWKDTPSQVSVKKRSERLTNLAGAFRLANRGAVRGKTVILIDDVTTTGATLEEAAKTVCRGKPRRIIKMAVAGG